MTNALPWIYQSFKALDPCLAMIPLTPLGTLLFLGTLLLLASLLFLGTLLVLAQTDMNYRTMAKKWEELLKAGPLEDEPGPFRGDLATLDIVPLFKDAGLVGHLISEHDGRYSVTCPFRKGGTPEIFVAKDGPRFTCSHTACSEHADCCDRDRGLMKALIRIDEDHPGLVDSHCKAHPGLFHADGNECAFAVKHRCVSFWSRWGFQESRAARISFPPDQMAVLSYNDEWTGSTILPGSAFGVMPIADDKGPLGSTDDQNIPRVRLFIPGRRLTLNGAWLRHVIGQNEPTFSED